MKVLDLQCANWHRFEGWFGSEADYLDQQHRNILQCPVCKSSDIVKCLSAPRLSFGAVQGGSASGASSVSHETGEVIQEVQDLWLQACQHVIEHSVDVGADFAQVARKIHYGEVPQQMIRGQATLQQARDLREEGIDAVPMLIPEFMQGPRH